MHGRPRAKGPPDPERVKATAQKAELLGRLNAAVLQARSAGPAGPAELQLTARLLELNPEMYTAWNHRREALVPVFKEGGQQAMQAAAEELALTLRALTRNLKSYSAWHHRKWVIGHRLTSLEAEITLVETLLDADDRNFHGWAYRRFVADLMGMPVQRELEYTTRKIQHNFSNYSAWHYRSKLLPLLHSEPGVPAAADDSPSAAAERQAMISSSRAGATGALVLHQTLEIEYELVSQAFFTEPEDQSGWIYHRWLLGCSVAHWQAAPESEAERARLADVLGCQLALVSDLLDLEPGSVWARKTRAHLLGLMQRVGGAAGGSAGRGSGGEAADCVAAAAAWEDLEGLDPYRAGYYRHACSVSARASV
uniref:Geranylgeranyl transferase type-2 subunit alpha n=3 Tax=Auxenochlorella protothecoides TaxID=3075 RepID=A0A1D2A5B0_AUXPR